MKLTSLLRAAGKPRLVLFDLDYTLWPWGLDQYKMKPPYYKKDNGVYDANGTKMDPFPEAEKCLAHVKDQGIDLAAISRTYYYHGGAILLYWYGWSEMFTFKEIFPGRKTMHVKNIHEASGIPYSEMLLFDDEKRNIEDLAPLGIHCVEVNPQQGINLNLVKKALESFGHSHAGETQKAKAIKG